jgi:large subunit ribosomal protein L6
MSTEGNEILEVQIPEGVSVSINGNDIEIKGSLGTNRRAFNDALIEIGKNNNSIHINAVKTKGLLKKALTTQRSFKKELENDIRGVTEYFERRMRIVFAHFPINVEVKGDRLYINNIIGERVPRISKIVGGTKIEVKGQNVRVYGTSLDDLTQTTANIRHACKIRNKDSRVFQDGLYYEIE